MGGRADYYCDHECKCEQESCACKPCHLCRRKININYYSDHMRICHSQNIGRKDSEK
ncbi:MAG: hypothetical protein UV48_C0012G0003 [Candidatus Azambacteria bacterium GW2011_GWA2_42_9]|uniref:Uncharacterized protein n=3 Tax=Candidatus Azamiibacteriota TaxID=1752741 RepID=A0A0G1BH79_9BACT|nr:MAG: hypothetical protein UV07_C0012G0003 [Candidatus Azambacteria bacterium GW2011_GWB1_42_17]KKS45641.1 MAG: hypothetical protein UV10_C0017G0007 [Candidatus Azambacteria bacterium GW2011_GWA1_42_19]KKS75431.1 MAG: hypothetical protein UV48_C0012G0003 [Candidatus Azambacteria bacterium GW2011_GWA2_42_9]KKS88082.1 MAG: hypothetical protein UV62_C0015G0003 [Parcubacteria group bacterium GW2011_GWC1_43_11]